MRAEICPCASVAIQPTHHQLAVAPSAFKCDIAGLGCGCSCAAARQTTITHGMPEDPNC